MAARASPSSHSEPEINKTKKEILNLKFTNFIINLCNFQIAKERTCLFFHIYLWKVTTNLIFRKCYYLNNYISSTINDIRYLITELIHLKSLKSVLIKGVEAPNCYLLKSFSFCAGDYLLRNNKRDDLGNCLSLSFFIIYCFCFCFCILRLPFQRLFVFVVGGGWSSPSSGPRKPRKICVLRQNGERQRRDWAESAERFFCLSFVVVFFGSKGQGSRWQKARATSQKW